MPIQKKISMSKDNPRPRTWYDAYKQVRYKTPPAPSPQVIDDKEKARRRQNREDQHKKHDWKRQNFDE